MNLKKVGFMLTATALLGLSGCGSDNRQASTTASMTASQSCIACHGNTNYRSPVTGAIITDEWQASAHNTRNGASCPDCHTTNGHPSSGALPNIPGSDAVCLNCHTSTSMRTYNAHFVGGSTYDATKAAYVTPYDANTCRTCHNPHDTTTLLTVNEQWAESGHGKVTNEPWMHYQWRGSARNDCQRCHTGGGFRYLMQTGANPTSAIFGKYTTGREALGCKGCHTDYSWNRLTPAVAFSTPYTPSLSVPATFPNASVIGDTQLCIPCHTGTGGGSAIEAYAGDLTNTTFGTFNSHYMAAAAIMYVKSGFTGFVPAGTAIGTTTYGATLTSTDDGGSISSTHRKLGTAAIVGDHGITANDGIDSNGPCVTCHMKGGHSLEINAAAFTAVCVKCHDKEGSTALTTANFKSVFIEPQSEVFLNALALAKDLLKTNYNIEYDSANYPYFFPTGVTHSRTNGVKNWTTQGVDSKSLIGACYNINLLSREPAAFAHARTYTRRLVYDTIDFLDDGVINRSVGATAIAKSLISGNPVYGFYTKGTKAYTTSATVGDIAPGTSESMLFLLNYDRNTGAWKTPERP